MSDTQSLSRWGKAQRAIATHLGAAISAGVLAFGIASEDTHKSLSLERETFEQLAVYAGCGHRDSVNNFYWSEFPQAMGENGEPLVVKASSTKKRGKP